MGLDPQTPRSSARRPLRGPFTRWPRAADAVLAIVVFLVTVFVKSEGPDEDLAIRSLADVPIAGFLVLATSSGALYWRWSTPLVVFGVTLAALALTQGVALLARIL